MVGYLDKLEKELRSVFQSESSGHDIYHGIRVCNLASNIQEKEGGDKQVIQVASLAHDIHRILEKESGRYCAPKDSLSKVREIYVNAGIEQDVMEKALHCIEFHEEYSFSKQGKTVDDIETLILQDADNLDAIGAIGVARACMFAGAYGLALWLPDVPVNKDPFEESNMDVSEIHHFYHKLLKLKDSMNTETAKKIADKRHNFMEDFLEEFFQEWDGKR